MLATVSVMRDGLTWVAATLVIASVAVALWCARLSPPEVVASQDATEAVLPLALDAQPVGAPPSASDTTQGPCRGEVLVIAAHEDPRHSTASVLMPDGNTDVWHTGQSVAGFVVDAIHYDRVSLKRGAQTCQLYIGEGPAPVTASTEPNLDGLVPWLARDVDYEAGELLVPREIVDRIFDEAGTLVAGTHAVRVDDGLRLARVSGVLQTLGFARGDVLHSVNGYQLDDPQRMLEAFAKLQSADHLVLSFSRGTQRAELDVQVFDTPSAKG
jgi:hypothetical protein